MIDTVLGALPPEVAQGGAVGVLASIAFGFYRYVWKPQQDRMDAFVARSEAKLEERLAAAEKRIDTLEGELEQCQTEHRRERETTARLRLALIQANIPIPGTHETGP